MLWRATSSRCTMDMWNDHFYRKGVFLMSNEKEILNHFFKGDSQRTIAAVLHVSRNTVAKVVQACHEHPIEAHELDRLDHGGYEEKSVNKVFYDNCLRLSYGINRSGYIMDNSPRTLPQFLIVIVHFLVASNVARYNAFSSACALGKTLRWRFKRR